MKKATFKEYEEARKEIMSGGRYMEYTHTDEYGRIHKTICCESGENFWELTENDITEFWSTKYPDSRKYEIQRELARGTGTNMEEADYQKLASMSDTKHMTDDEARLFIGEELGFDPLKVEIIHEVADYYREGDYYKAGSCLKKWHTYHRDPQYNATDWNYFRFDVCGWQYEYENGSIRFYVS